jgi:hypothetical protein
METETTTKKAIKDNFRLPNKEEKKVDSDKV